jgi:hypothetical protein
MQTTKRTVIRVDNGDQLEVWAGESRVLIQVDKDRHGGRLILDFPEGAEMIFDPRDEDPDGLMETPLPKNATVFV